MFKTTTKEPQMSTAGYTVFTRSSTDHALVHIISHVSDYFAAHELAKKTSASIMYRDQFEANFEPTSPNRYNGILR